MARTVLICDDALFMRTMLAEILEQAGFEVAGQAATGAEAVDMFRDLRPDLVTMDIIMPDMGGIEAVKTIMREFPEANIVMCSAMGQQALVIEAIQAGARDFVVKPFQPARVLKPCSGCWADRRWWQLAGPNVSSNSMPRRRASISTS
jgi:two-component system chemotaxis response regulator CheY